jgi:hypothetical protein
MKLTSKPLAVIIFIILFGGIAITTAMGWWQTTSSKNPATFSEGEFAGQANPADIRGSYTFGDIEEAFGIDPQVLAQAFGVEENDPAAFQVKSLEEIYGESGTEIGTSSVRLFVALYKGLPYDLSEEVYLLRPAVDILKKDGASLTPEQLSYLEAHMADPTGLTLPTQPPVVATAVTSAPATSEHVVKGKTTFQELLDWGLAVENIETILGAPLPGADITIKDYCSAQGLDFESIKTALQAEVDKLP